MVVLSSYFCAGALAQSVGDMKGGNNNPPPVNSNSGGSQTTPVPSNTPNVFNNQTANVIFNEVMNSPTVKKLEQQARAKVNAKINSTKVGRGASKFHKFLQRIGLAKKTPVRKVKK